MAVQKRQRDYYNGRVATPSAKPSHAAVDTEALDTRMWEMLLWRAPWLLLLLLLLGWVCSFVRRDPRVGEPLCLYLVEID